MNKFTRTLIAACGIAVLPFFSGCFESPEEILAAQNEKISGEMLVATGSVLSDLRELQECIKDILAGKSINAHYGNMEKTPLHLAVMAGKDEVVAAFLKMGANPEGKDFLGRTPIFYVRTIASAEMLLDAGANVNVRDYARNTPLSAGPSASDVVQNWLKSKGAKTPKEIEDLNRAVGVAIQNGDVSSVKKNIAAGAGVNEQCKDGFTPLLLAVALKQNEIVEWLLENGAGVDTQGFNGVTPLHIAAGVNNIAAMKLLIARKADVNVAAGRINCGKREISGASPIFAASGNGFREAVALLLDNGAAVNQTDSDGRTPLFYASSVGVIELLLARGAAINREDNSGTTPLTFSSDENIRAFLKTFGAKSFEDIVIECAIVMGVVDGNDLEAIKKWCAEESDLNAPESKCVLALLAASFIGNIEVIKCLAECGVDVNAKDSNGVTALMLASENGHNNVVRVLIGKGADVNAKGPDGETALMLAFRNGRNNVVRTLIENGADVNAKGEGCGRTVLMGGAEKGYAELAKDLIARGADVNAKNSNGATALMAASFNGHNNVVRMLIENGADVNAKDPNGATALEMAESLGHDEIVAYLSQKAGNRSLGNASASDAGRIERLSRKARFEADTWNKKRTGVCLRNVRVEREDYSSFVWVCLRGTIQNDTGVDGIFKINVKAYDGEGNFIGPDRWADVQFMAPAGKARDFRISLANEDEAIVRDIKIESVERVSK